MWGEKIAMEDARKVLKQIGRNMCSRRDGKGMTE
jgi:hypothetical protein